VTIVFPSNKLVLDCRTRFGLGTREISRVYVPIFASLARFYASFIILASDASMSLGSDNITKSMRRGRVAEYALVAAGFATAIIFIINNL
jgi:hypothetical protein